MSSGPCVRQFRSRSSALVAATTGSYAPNPATGARHVKGTRGPFPPRATPRVAPHGTATRRPHGTAHVIRGHGSGHRGRPRARPPVPASPGAVACAEGVSAHLAPAGCRRAHPPALGFSLYFRLRSSGAPRAGGTPIALGEPPRPLRRWGTPTPAAPHRHRRLTNRYQRNVRIRMACRNRAAFARRGCTRSRNARASASSLRNRARRRRRSASQSTSLPAPPPAPSASRAAPAAPADGSRSSCSGIASSPQSVPPTFPRPGGLTPAKG
ncbi:hypothetical protein STREPTOSP366_31620 [Streptomyces variabilis]